MSDNETLRQAFREFMQRTTQRAAARPMTKPYPLGRTNGQIVAFIRGICAAELDMPADTAFFRYDYHPGEHPDAALLRLFCEERPHHGTDLDTVAALIHG
jgi:hypothetical protein